MQGRVEHKILIENKILNSISSYPDFIKRYYYSLSSKTHNTKLRYVDNVVKFLNDYSKNNINSITSDVLNSMTSFDVEVYMEKIKYIHKGNDTTEMSGSSKACIYSSLSSFFSFLKKQKIIENSPFDDKIIERPKVQEGDIVFLSPEEISKIENLILHDNRSDLKTARRDDWKYRDYLLFRIPIINGLRVTALSEINIEDINMEKMEISVIEKGNVSKKVYFDRQTKLYLDFWIRKRARILAKKSDKQTNALFISNQGTRMTVRSIELIIKKYAEEVTSKHITPHKLRSTFGTNLYQETRDVYLVSEMLGHKSTAPTKRYTKVFDENKRNAIDIMAKLYSGKEE